ncbi:MAG: response regulator transcription factor [Planctomycetaceae bacterium]|nr:response regulator transcription factor [Planctomycetaceae bacterium]
MNHSSEPQLKTRVFLIEDHPLLRDGLRMQIEEQPDLQVCGEADDVAPALEGIREANPDVAIIDLSLKTGSGLDLIKQLASAKRAPQMIVFSMQDEHFYAERALRAGAQGYVHKHANSESIIDAIRHVRDGKLYVSQEVHEQMMRKAVASPRVPSSGQPEEALTDRELQVLESLGKGHTVKEIGDRLSLSPKTIETYRDRIRKKLDIPSSTQLLRYAFQWVADKQVN